MHSSMGLKARPFDAVTAKSAALHGDLSCNPLDVVLRQHGQSAKRRDFTKGSDLVTSKHPHLLIDRYNREL